jgi:AcrR family transcriptional regulator
MSRGRGQTDATSASPLGEPVPAASRREANKLDKLNRIKVAAIELFVTKGFDDTTVREIASRAGVGLGTLFSYSLNKRDLLFLLGNDRLDDVADAAGAAIDPQAPLSRNLLAIFGAHYRFFAQDAVLGRLVLREMTFYESGTQAERFRAIRQRVLEHVERSLLFAEQRGEIGTRRDPEFDSGVLFAIYQVELRRWLTADNPDPDAGLGRLARALQVCIDGLAPEQKRSSKRKA